MAMAVAREVEVEVEVEAERGVEVEEELNGAQKNALAMGGLGPSQHHKCTVKTRAW